VEGRKEIASVLTAPGKEKSSAPRLLRCVRGGSGLQTAMTDNKPFAVSFLIYNRESRESR